MKTKIENDFTIRPRINRVEDLKKIAEQIQASPTALVNFFTDVGLEVFERSLPIIKEEIKITIFKKLGPKKP